MTGAAVPRRPEDVLWYEGPAAYLSSAELAKRMDMRAGDPWLRGVALGAVGRYADARRLLLPLNGSLPLSTLASQARQVGRHAEAETLDRRALDLARSDEARADATSGLVADAVGRGDAAAAAARLPAARLAVHGWRATTRLHWVAAELALLCDAAGEAVAAGDAAVGAARAASAPRHLTKSLLVRGVARKAAGDAAGARTDLLDALARAREQQLPTLVWPAAAVAAELEPGLLTHARTALAAIVDGLGERGPAFAARADVSAVLGRTDHLG